MSRNWNKIKERYIQGHMDKDGVTIFESYRTLGKIFNIPFRTIASRSQKEEWTVLRDKYRTNFRTNVAHKIKEEITDDYASRELKYLKQAEIALELVMNLMKNANKPADIHKLSMAQKNLFDIAQRCMGLQEGIKNSIPDLGELKDMLDVLKN